MYTKANLEIENKADSLDKSLNSYTFRVFIKVKKIRE